MTYCRSCGEETGSKRVICPDCELKICQEYVDKKKSAVKLGLEYGIAHATVTSILSRNRVKLRTLSEAVKNSRTPEICKKISESHKGKKRSKYHKQKISKGQKGRVMSKEMREKISKTLKGKCLGVKRSEETRKKMSKSKQGPNNPNYKDGLSRKISDWKFLVKLRDNFQCQSCRMTREEHFKKYGYDVIAHHIDGDRTNNRIENGITLCDFCHKSLHHKLRRTNNDSYRVQD